MTKELREQLHEKLLKHLCSSCFDDKSVLEDIDSVFSAFEQEIIEAERRGREKMRREVIWQCERELAYNGAS